jgi:hypothetical protein
MDKDEDSMNENVHQFAQITTYFPISWRNTFNRGTGGIEINVTQDKSQVEFVFGDDIYRIEYTDEITVGQVFDAMYGLPPLAGTGKKSQFRLELDEWCQMDADTLLHRAALCQGCLNFLE